MPVNYQNVDALIQRAYALELIRLEPSLMHDGKPSMANKDYRDLLRAAAKTLEVLRASITIRIMAYDYADLCGVKLEEQRELLAKRDRMTKFNYQMARQIVRTAKQKKAELLQAEVVDQQEIQVLEQRIKKFRQIAERHVDRHNPSQLTALENLTTARKQLPKQQPVSTIHNPNIIVNCDSGRHGELGCKAGNIKVYQAVYAGSYGVGGYKDVYLVDGKIAICAAAGGKCNVSIGNPFRIIGWYINYVSQGSTNALIRCWEIPQRYFEELIKHCATEWEVKQAKDGNVADIYVELCDHKAPNQFGLWTHEKNAPTTPNLFGVEFLSKSENLITYYDPRGTHKPNAHRDGSLRDVGRLFDHLGVPQKASVRFHDLGTALTSAKGNLAMNQSKRAEDLALLAVIELLSKSTDECALGLKTIDKASVRMFANFLSYNDLNPQQLNQSKLYTPTGLIMAHLKRESNFMLEVYKTSSWHLYLRQAITSMDLPDDAMPLDVIAELPAAFKGVKTYSQGRTRLLELLQGTSTQDGILMFEAHSPGYRLYDNMQIIDGLCRILRPICRQGQAKMGGLDRVSGKNESFAFEPLKKLKFEVGASHRVSRKTSGVSVNPLGKFKGAGLTSTYLFKGHLAFEDLSSSVETSDSSFQLLLHSEVIELLQDHEIPVLGGISGTTRDIFQYCSTFTKGQFWALFAVVAAFMIKFHYHSLTECFIAAMQYYQRGVSSPSLKFEKLSPDHIYAHIALMVGIKF